jgi:hypothetical protein
MRYGWIGLGLLALAGVSSTTAVGRPARPPAFIGASQARTVSIYANLQVENTKTGQHHQLIDEDADQSAPTDFSDLALDVGIGIVLDESVYANGSSRQQSFPGGNEIRFDAVADINVSGFTEYPWYSNSIGNSNVAFSYVFDVAETTVVALSMQSDLFGVEEENFFFSLTRKDDAVVIWDQVVIYDEELGPIRDFTQRLRLKPGRYILDASIRARSYLYGDVQRAGRTTAAFTIVPQY